MILTCFKSLLSQIRNDQKQHVISNCKIQWFINSKSMGNKLGFGKKQPQQSNNFQQQNYNQNNFDDCEGVYQQTSGNGGSGSIRLLNDKAEDKEKKVVAVIITFSSGGTYDGLFTSVQQKSLQGTKVEVYACDSFYLESLIKAFDGQPQDDVAVRLMKTIETVDKDCVVLNWECCGLYSSKTFPENPDKLFGFLKKVIDRGHMTMFSDFSLKALVNSWKPKYGLGPNPFVQVDEYTGNFQIRFKSGQLKECPSAQLQIIGQMCDEGRCNILAAGGTILYCVDSKQLNHKDYKLEVLTVVTNRKAPKDNYVSKIGQFEGTAGHVLLTYPSGGMLLSSMGHWIELMKIDTSPQKLFEVAERQFGAAKASEMKQAYMQMNSAQQECYISDNAREFVRNQAPCTNMNKKARMK